MNKKVIKEMVLDIDPNTLQPKIIKISNKCKKMLVMGDIHMGEQDDIAIETALKFGESEKIDSIYLNGDIGEFPSVSRYGRKVNQRDLTIDLDKVRIFLMNLRKRFPKAIIYYKFGNHEARIERWKMEKATEISELPSLRLENLLHFKDYGIKKVGINEIAKFGDLYIVHGHELDSGGGVNIARNRLLMAFDNVLSGHSHVTQSYPKKKINGELLMSWVVGCLRTLNPDWKPNNNWNHGCALVQRLKGTHFRVDNRMISGKEIF